MTRSIACIVLMTLTGVVLSAQERQEKTGGALWLPAIFGDHMVLQQGQDLPLWGKGKPGEKVSLTVGAQSGETTVAADGTWMLRLKPLPAAREAVSVTITSAGESRRFDDVLIGDVWLCAGQSNMAMGIGNMKDGKQVVAKADHPELRLFLLPRSVSFEKAEDVEARWVVCTPETLAPQGYGWGGFSAIGYYFGAALLEMRNVPIGLIGAYDGGTRIQCWTSLEALQRLPGNQTFTAGTVREFLRKKASLSADMAIHTNDLLPKWEAEHRAWKEDYDAKNADWMKRREQAIKAGEPAPERPSRPKLSNRPLAPAANYTLATVLFNAKIHPLAPFALTGVLWYQGEANAYPKQYDEYRKLLPIMIGDWRNHWGRSDLPFLYVQLPNLISHGGDPQYKDWWPALRESQRAALATPHTAMVVTIDVGDPNDLHPTIKKPIADRLVRAARRLAYNEDVVSSGPRIDAAVLQGEQVVLTFTEAEDGLVTGRLDEDWRFAESQAAPAHFELAGTDGEFVSAHARIEADHVIVWSEQVPKPCAVRYAWASNPEPPVNLYNREGMPASPFSVQIQTP